MMFVAVAKMDVYKPYMSSVEGGSECDVEDDLGPLPGLDNPFIIGSMAA
jgi:hypothetical protein